MPLLAPRSWPSFAGGGAIWTTAVYAARLPGDGIRRKPDRRTAHPEVPRRAQPNGCTCRKPKTAAGLHRVTDGLEVEVARLIGGTTMAAPTSLDSDALTRIARPIASRLLSMTIGLSLKRKFLTGWLILPFSIRNVPSRVRPV
jgi:hypothetical protein